MKYNIMTFNVEDMLLYSGVERNADDNYVIKFEYSFSEKAGKGSAGGTMFIKNALAETNVYDENALTYQIRRALEEAGELAPLSAEDEKSDEPSDALADQLFYMDFNGIKFDKEDTFPEKTTYTEEEIYSLSQDVKFHFMFKNGFTVIYDSKNPDEDGCVKVNYVPFEKSGSMSRTGRMTFIRETTKKLVEPRLQLGVRFNDMEMILSKYYAYRGLFMTDAKRVTDESLVLNHETVIVLPDKDKKNVIPGVELLTGKLVEGSEKSKDKPYEFKLDKSENEYMYVDKPFDGEGLISREYSEKLNAFLRTGKEKPATSYQVRMPFTKGMLHEVDFHAFFGEYIKGSHMVTDAFGIQRDLDKAQMILTTTMFKAVDWVKAMTEWADPMEEFFRKFHEYEHALYISNTSLTYTGNKRTTLNYQFLNTIKIDNMSFSKLVEKHINYALQLKNDTDIQFQFLFSDLNDDEYNVNEEEKQEKLYGKKSWKDAIKLNREFLHDKKLEGDFNGISQKLIKDVAEGKLIVDGECRFLSRDLSLFLRNVALDVFATTGEPDTEKVIDLLWENRLRANRFYMSGTYGGKKGLDKDKWYGVLRSPHLSQNEQCVLKPYIAAKGSIHDRYLSHLKGIVMIAYNSLAANCLGGADFDGDLVKVVYEPIVNKAMAKLVMREDERILPIIDIPSIGGEKKKPSESIDYMTIKHTFSNSVGRISNSAIKIGRHEYWSGKEEEKYRNMCAFCTVLTGLEIDAAKSGVHPYLGDVIGLVEGENDGFLRDLKEIRKLKYPTLEDVKEYANRVPRVLQERGAEDELFYDSNIETLAYYFAVGVKKLNAKSEGKQRAPRGEKPVLFRFQENPNLAINDDLLMRMAGMIRAYQHINRVARFNSERTAKFEGVDYMIHIRTLLMTQYDSLFDEMSSRYRVNDVVSSIIVYIRDKFKDLEELKTAINKLIDEKWHYTFKEDRAAVLGQIMACGTGTAEMIPEAVELLSNFKYSGFKLLYYFLINEAYERLADGEGRRFEEAKPVNESDAAAVYAAEYYNRYLEMYQEALSEKKASSQWKMTLINEIRKQLAEEYISMNEALRYAFTVRDRKLGDPSGTFFYNVFTGEEICKNVKPDSERKSDEAVSGEEEIENA